MQVFYHNDLDGQCCAAIINLVENISFDKMTPVDHDMHFPLEKINKNETIYIVDFFPNRKIFNEILSITSNVIWIDHHKSSIKSNKDLEHIEGLRRIGDSSACKLTWEFFFDKTPLPEIVKEINLYDTWSYKSYKTLYIANGLMGSFTTIPDIRLMLEENEENNELLENYIDKGEIIFESKRKENKDFVINNGYVCNFYDFNVLVVNKQGNSQLFIDCELDDNIDFVCTYYFNGTNYKYSLFNCGISEKNNIDLSVFAKTYGGGGHAGAAGFCHNSNIFKSNKISNYKDWLKS